MAIQPLADRILIEPLGAEEKTSGGIYIPDSAKEKPQKGTVVAVGSGKKSDSGETIALEVQVGQTVLYGKYAGTEIQDGDKEYLIVRESDIVAVIS
jgi:chaperonin GroES